LIFICKSAFSCYGNHENKHKEVRMIERILPLAVFTGVSLLLTGWCGGTDHHSGHTQINRHCQSRPCATAPQSCPAVAATLATARKADGIFNRAWELKRESLQGVPANAEKPQRYITMQIAPDGKIAGCSGVNRYFGTVKIDSAKNVIDFKSNPIGSTRMAGPGMAYEDAYLKMLSTVDSYEVKGNKLFLKSAGKTVAEFQD